MTWVHVPSPHRQCQTHRQTDRQTDRQTLVSHPEMLTQQMPRVHVTSPHNIKHTIISFTLPSTWSMQPVYLVPVNSEGHGRKGIRHKNGGMMKAGTPIVRTGWPVSVSASPCIIKPTRWNISSHGHPSWASECFFWYWLTWEVLDKRLLNSCSSSSNYCLSTISTAFLACTLLFY